MIPDIPERSSYFDSALYLMFGLFFIVYPIHGIANDNLIFIGFKSKIRYHLHGLDAIIIGLSIIIGGVGVFLSGIKNILEKRVEDLYTKPKYPTLVKIISWTRKISITTFLIWSTISCTKTLL